jgi:hypothetical protein
MTIRYSADIMLSFVVRCRSARWWRDTETT